MISLTILSVLRLYCIERKKDYLMLKLIRRETAVPNSVDFSPPRYGSKQRSVHVGFVMDRVVLGHAFLQVLHFSVFSILPPMSHPNIRCFLADAVCRKEEEG